MLDDQSFTVKNCVNTIAERTEEIYPHECHVYRRRWEQLATVPRRVLPAGLSSNIWNGGARHDDALSEELRLSDLRERGRVPGPRNGVPC